MEERKLRRLFNIRPNTVSIVDRAANNRKFIIIKRAEQTRGEGINLRLDKFTGECNHG